MWLNVVGAEDVDTSHGIYFSQADQLFQAAIDGQGVALIANVMVERALAEGKLVQPFSTRLPVKMSYHLVTSPAKARIAKVSAFREWILEESAYLRADSDQLRSGDGL
jgi:LysR family glycine cleavage system transcriptional activator